jgi:hypothetical protein
MATTIPPHTSRAGDPGHPDFHNNISDVLSLLAQALTQEAGSASSGDAAMISAIAAKVSGNGGYGISAAGVGDGLTGTLGMSMPRWAVTSNTIATTTGQAYFRRVTLPTGTTVTNLAMRVGSTGKTGGTHGWYALADSAFNVLAASADQADASTTWGTPNTDQALPVTTDGVTKYVTSYPGSYYIVAMVASSGQPNFCGAAAAATGIAGGTPLLFGTISGGATIPPVPGAALTTATAVAADSFYAYVT